MRNKYINIAVSIITLCLILLITFKYCGNKMYSSKEMDQVITDAGITKANYEDSLNFVRGQLDLQQEKGNAQTERVEYLEKYIDSLTAKHATTKQKLVFNKQDTGFVLAPNEYVHECENCFDLLGSYKNENKQLRFERDSYDSLMRNQNSLNEARVDQLEKEKLQFNKLLNDCRIARAYAPSCDTTRKLKLSVMGMFGNPFLPKGGGAGLIYEDKKFNEYGAHMILTDDGPVYMIHIAKTISFKRKK